MKPLLILLASCAVSAAATIELTTATAQQKADIRSALGLETSTTGGIGKVPVYDASGNLALRDNTPVGLGEGGNLLIAPFRKLRFVDSSNSELGCIYMWPGHSNGDELIFNSARFCYYWTDGIQFGSPATARDGRYVYFQPNTATGDDTTVEGVPISLANFYWSGSASVANEVWLQSLPLSAAAGSDVLRINFGASVGADHRLTGGTVAAEFSRTGLKTPGTNPAYTALEDGVTINWTVSPYLSVQNAKVTLGGNRTLAIRSAAEGMRGSLIVTQDGTGSRTLVLPGGSKTPDSGNSLVTLSTAAGAVDVLHWEYDGQNYYWTIAKSFTGAVDADASAFFSRTSITDEGIKTAVDNLVIGLKAATDGGTTLWDKLYCIYPFVGGNATAHSKNLKADAYNLTFSGSPTHNANGVTGDGSAVYADTGFGPHNISGTPDTWFGYVYNRTQLPTDGSAGTVANFYGCDVTQYALVRRNGSYLSMDGFNDNSTVNAIQIDVAGDFRGHIANMIYGSASQALWIGSSKSTTTTTAVANADHVRLWAHTGASSERSNANLAFAAFGQSMSDSAYASFRTLIDTFETALGRNN